MGSSFVKDHENEMDEGIINPLKGLTVCGWHFEQNVYSRRSLVRAIKSSEGSGNRPKIIELYEIDIATMR